MNCDHVIGLQCDAQFGAWPLYWSELRTNRTPPDEKFIWTFCPLCGAKLSTEEIRKEMRDAYLWEAEDAQA